MMDGVNDRVSFVDNIITVEAAVVRDRDIPLEHLLVSVCVNVHTSVAEIYKGTESKKVSGVSSAIKEVKNENAIFFKSERPKRTY